MSIIDWFWSLLPWALAAIDVGMALSATLHAVLWKRDDRAAIGWIGLAWLAPFIGSLLYFGFGINRIQRKGTSLRLRESWTHPHEVQLTDEEEELRDKAAREYPNLLRLALLGKSLANHRITPGNQVEPLLNGEQTFPAMLKAIREAEHTVSFSTYIFDNDDVGQEFLEALVEAQERGVEVRILIDHVGAQYSRPTMVSQLRKAGLNAKSFLPTVVPRLFKYANLRNHRKIMVADGKIGFVGGTNIRVGHCVERDLKSPVQCLHFRVQGPVVAHFQEAFAIDWAFASGESLHGPEWFPHLERAGDVWARGIPDGPDEDFEKLAEIMLGAISAARRRIRIITPYFLPPAPLEAALRVAAMSGVRVDILLTSRNNVPIVEWATLALLPELLAAGCHVYQMEPPFNHTKLFVVDRLWSLIGSTNWDPRSLRLNFEYNVECYSESLGQELDAMIDERIKTAREFTYDELVDRHVLLRIRDGLARLASPYL